MDYGNVLEGLSLCGYLFPFATKPDLLDTSGHGMTELLKAEREMFEPYPNIRLPLELKGREDGSLVDPAAPFNPHSIDDILGYRRMQHNMKGDHNFNFNFILPKVNTDYIR